MYYIMCTSESPPLRYCKPFFIPFSLSLSCSSFDNMQNISLALIFIEHVLVFLFEQVYAMECFKS